MGTRQRHSRPSFWFRYVDDTFTLFDNNNAANQFLHFLNSCHTNIKFTVESEENNTISFLDILIKRSNHAFSTSIYRKKTVTGFTLNGALLHLWSLLHFLWYRLWLHLWARERCRQIYSLFVHSFSLGKGEVKYVTTLISPFTRVKDEVKCLNALLFL